MGLYQIYYYLTLKHCLSKCMSKMNFRFNVINWGSVEREMGLIAGGGDNGVISLWDPAKILRYFSASLIKFQELQCL